MTAGLVIPALATASLQAFWTVAEESGYVGRLAGKQEVARPLDFPVRSQCFQQSGRGRNDSALRPLPLDEMFNWPLPVDVGDSQMSRFAEPQSGCITSQQHGVMFGVV